MPRRNVVPKPKQKPHPPLWVACSRRETIRIAARKGIGALSFSFIEPEEAKDWVDDYYRLLASEECVPAGFAVNPNLAVVVPFMCHPDEQTAIERGIDGAHFFGYSLAHYYVFGRASAGTDQPVGGIPAQPQPLWLRARDRARGRRSAGGETAAAGDRVAARGSGHAGSGCGFDRALRARRAWTP